MDFKLPIALPITVGAGFTFRTETESIGSGDSKIDVTYTYKPIVARARYHFGFVKNLDVSAGLDIGYSIGLADVKYGKDYDSIPKPKYTAAGTFVYGVIVGGRFFFTKNIGAYLELNPVGLGASAGLSLKF